MAISGALIPVNLAQVQSLIGKTVIIGSQTQETDSPLTEDSIRRLKSILRTVKTQEEQFYRMLNISGDVNSALINFQKVLDDKLNKSGAIKLLNVSESDLDNVATNIGERIIIKSLEDLFSMEIKGEFGDALIKNFKDDVVVLTAEEFIKQTQSHSKNKNQTLSKNKKIHTFYNITGNNNSGKKGLQKYIGKIIYDSNKKGKDKFQIQFTDDIPKKYADILENQYGITFPDLITDSVNIIENTKNYVNRVITDSEIKSYIIADLNSAEKKYSVNTSAGSIKGFLGEITMNAVLRALTNIYPLATGAIRKICKEGKGQEIPIDIILKNFGFQVKNYAEIKSTASFGHKTTKESMGLGNFVVNRLRPREDIGQVLLELYGSYAYNQIADNPLAQQNFGPTRQRIESIVNDTGPLEKLFDQHIDNILKISDEFAANSKFFAKERVYYNTFFIVNRRFVPSSRILQTLINKLQNTKNSEAIQSSYAFSFNVAEKGYAYPYQRQSSLSALEYANKSKINYSIRLNLDEILQEALNNV